MYTHIHNESLTPNLEVFNVLQLLTHVSFYFLENPGSQSFSSSDEKDGSQRGFYFCTYGSEPRLSTSRIWSLYTVPAPLVIYGVCGECGWQLAMAEG